MTCRCSCKAYGGACDCRFDGLNAGRNESAARVSELEAALREVCSEAATQRPWSTGGVAGSLDRIHALTAKALGEKP